jgi:hypothetical protein
MILRYFADNFVPGKLLMFVLLIHTLKQKVNSARLILV